MLSIRIHHIKILVLTQVSYRCMIKLNSAYLLSEDIIIIVKSVI